MIEHAALPEGTVVTFARMGGFDVDVERTEERWVEVNAHCVDCVREWHPDGTPANWDAGEDVLPLDVGVVASVPAAWLASRIERAIEEWGDDGALRDLAVDAGLS